MGSQSFGIDPIVIRSYAEEVRSIVELGVQVGIVLGGGNIFIGRCWDRPGIGRPHGHACHRH